MKIHALTAAIAVIAFSLFFPSEAHAQQNAIQAQTAADAERDAQGYNAITWAAYGCLGGLACGIGGGIPIYLSQTSQRPTPADRLIGKPPDYVQAYTEKYQQKAKSKRLRYTAGGCTVGTGACLVSACLFRESIADFILLSIVDAFIEEAENQ